MHCLVYLFERNEGTVDLEIEEALYLCRLFFYSLYLNGKVIVWKINYKVLKLKVVCISATYELMFPPTYEQFLKSVFLPLFQFLGALLMS